MNRIVNGIKKHKVLVGIAIALISVGLILFIGLFVGYKLLTKAPADAPMETPAPIVVTVVVTPVPPTSTPTNTPTPIPTVTSTPRPTATPVTIPGLTAPLVWHNVELMVVEAHLQDKYPIGNGRYYGPTNTTRDTLLVIEITSGSSVAAINKLHDYYDEVYVVTNSGEEENCDLLATMINRTPRKAIWAFIIPKDDDFELYEIYFPGEEGVSLDSFF